MPLNPTKEVEIIIKTTDKSLLDDLKAENIPDLRMSQRHFHVNVADTKIIENLFTYVIVPSTIFALKAFGAWLFKRFKEKIPDNTTINNEKIVNYQQINTINYNISLEISQENTQKNKKD